MPRPPDDDEPIFLTHVPGSLSPEEERERRRRAEAVEAQRKRKKPKKPKADRPAKKQKRKPLTAIFSRTAFGKRRADAARRREDRADPPPAVRKAPDLNETWRGFKTPRRSEPRPEREKRPRTVRFKQGVASGGRRLGQGFVRLGQTAGWGALDRTLHAARAVRRRRALEARPSPAPTATPWLIPALLGGLLRPFTPSGLLTVGLAGAFLAAAVLLLWFLPPVGAVACALALACFATLRLKAIVDVGHGRDDLEWPEWEESLAGASVSAGLLLLFLPALLLGWAAAGPGAVERGIPARVRALVAPQPDHVVARAAADAGRAYQEQAWRSHDLVREQRRAVGVAEPDRDEARRRAQAERQVASLQRLAGEAPPRARPPRDPSAAAAARRVTAEVLAGVRRWLDPRGHAGKALAARVCLLAALLLFPMALLAAATLKSAYAALFLPLLLGSALRAPLAYAATVALVLLVDLGLLLAVTVPYPVAVAWLGDDGSARVVAVGVAALLVVGLTLSSACVVGRFYRCRSDALGW